MFISASFSICFSWLKTEHFPGLHQLHGGNAVPPITAGRHSPSIVRQPEFPGQPPWHQPGRGGPPKTDATETQRLRSPAGARGLHTPHAEHSEVRAHHSSTASWLSRSASPNISQSPTGTFWVVLQIYSDTLCSERLLFLFCLFVPGGYTPPMKNIQSWGRADIRTTPTLHCFFVYPRDLLISACLSKLSL